MTACGRVDPHSCRIGAHLSQPVCAHCGAPDPIRGDGGMALVCPRCVRSLGRIAGEPYSASESVRARLMDASLDVVDLSGDGWRWTSSWPGAGDDRVAR